MTNAEKTAITEAIDAAGYSWAVSDAEPMRTLESDKVIITERVTFIATKRTEVSLVV